jgi:hypothetical protein
LIDFPDVGCCCIFSHGYDKVEFMVEEKSKWLARKFSNNWVIRRARDALYDWAKVRQ